MIDFEDVFENAPCGSVIADGGGRIIRANTAFARLVGQSPEHITGKRFADFLPIAGKIFYETHFAPTLLMEGRFSEVALEVTGAQGSRTPVLVNAEVRHAGTDAAQTWFTVFAASQRRLYERGLRDARDVAEAAVVNERANAELREQFIAVLGHDLRNPLASITSGIHLLDKENFSERGKKVVGLMSGSVLRATALIDNILDFARGRLGGGITLTRNAAEPLEPVLRQVVSELRSISPDQVIVETYALDAPVRCDRMRIGQLLSNLLGNALTHGAKDKPVRVDAHAGHGELVISVSNGGKPIPAEALERLFQPFFRGDDRVKHGLGLGLHIASEIARAHRGTLVARSDDLATTFVFAMPIEDGNNQSG